jgi:hypothetical protein
MLIKILVSKLRMLGWLLSERQVRRNYSFHLHCNIHSEEPTTKAKFIRMPE